MKPISILLVDNNSTFRQLVTDFLKDHHPHEVIVTGIARDGSEALTQAQALSPQLILLDLTMPGPSGFEVIPLLRQALPELGIVVLTAHNQEAYRKAALTAGADEVVFKQRLATDLLPTIRRVVQANQLSR